ncbi:MAG: LytTR family DNA-binding domain-containing protein [Bacteroidetes bacterium]|nr:LytTR family DNA-binding domain-containing protein [Bacteroidota bacterium]MBU1717983.1 LytTR family DNA-binding domain-containing protein [Bacteroidota bacterium]
MIRTIVIDDEPLAMKLISGFVEKTSFLELTGSFDSAIAALDYLHEESVDLIFLDIQMPDLSGTAFAKMIGNDTKIIFSTAYEKYALDGFRLQAVDYLLKPFGYEEFLKAADRARTLIELESVQQKVPEDAGEFLFLKSDYKILRINFQDILYIEGLKEYVRVFLTNDAKPIVSLNTLKSLELKLPSSRFMRVHRSFIVNLEYVKTIERSRILFKKVAIPVSEQYKEKFQEFLNRNII